MSDESEYNALFSWAEQATFEAENRIAELTAEVERLTDELEVTDKLLEERNRVMAAIPECPVHGGQCVPHAIDWIDSIRTDRAELRRENERLTAENQHLFDRANDVMAENERLRAALRPFADRFDRLVESGKREGRIRAVFPTVLITDLQQAAEALAPVTAGRDTSMEME